MKKQLLRRRRLWTSGVQQWHREAGAFLAIADLDVPLFNSAAETPNRQPERRQASGADCAEDYWKSMRLEALVSTGIAWEHVLREKQVRGTAVGTASSGNAVIKPTVSRWVSS